MFLHFHLQLPTDVASIAIRSFNEFIMKLQKHLQTYKYNFKAVDIHAIARELLYQNHHNLRKSRSCVIYGRYWTRIFSSMYNVN